ncbi:MAG: DUF2788 domain-containing protein [Aeromonas sp.]
MLARHFELLEQVGLGLFLLGIFLLIGLAIHDVLARANVPPLGRRVVWLVLFLGCAGFIGKGLIEWGWQQAGLG